MVDSVFEIQYGVKNNLSELKKRLKTGQKLKGKILECLTENRYILRVWNYNIYTESKKQFSKNEEINLLVEKIEPTLVFDLSRKNKKKSSNQQTNILI
jgi:hypothetical protein